jgi:hypothetical protein
MATSKKKSSRKKSKPANDKPSGEDSNETPLDLTVEDPPTTPSEEDAPETPRATVPEVPKSKAKPAPAKPAPAKPAVAKVRPGLEAGRAPKKGEFILRVKGVQVGDPHANRNFAIRAGQKLVQAKLCAQADLSIVEG